jgi:hypothetical protein
MKKILIYFLLLPSFSFAKSYAAEMKVCDTNTNCSKCYETIKITYEANTNTKQVRLLGKDLTVKDINEPMNKCQIADNRN